LGVLQGQIGDSFLSVWLTAVSLTDELKKKEEKHLAKPLMFRIGSLATAFSKSYIKTQNNKSNSNIFKKATEGVVRLGLHEKAIKNTDFPEMNKLDDYSKFDYRDAEKTENVLRLALKKVRSDDISKINLENAFQYMLDGINLAWDLFEVEKETLPASLPAAPALKFDKLKKVFGITRTEGKDEVDGKTQEVPQKIKFKEEKFPFIYDSDSV
jgi:hypothetical protein